MLFKSWENGVLQFVRRTRIARVTTSSSVRWHRGWWVDPFRLPPCGL